MEPFRQAAWTIGLTWALMGALYAWGRKPLRARLVQAGSVAQLPALAPQLPIRPGTWWSGAGTLWVFVVNIVTALWVIAAAIAPTVAAPPLAVQVALPAGVRVLGGVLFYGAQALGLGAMLYNPDYTPLYKPVRREFILATQGPYARVRHPRYVAEAALNVALALLTGVWLPLLGIPAWVLLAQQARAEEECLLALVGEPYREYRSRTGMFWPR